MFTEDTLYGSNGNEFMYNDSRNIVDIMMNIYYI
jgi:hypothetical protein